MHFSFSLFVLLKKRALTERITRIAINLFVSAFTVRGNNEYVEHWDTLEPFHRSRTSILP